MSLIPSLYVGIMTPGTTSRMRADTLGRVSDLPWEFVDTDLPFLSAPRPLRTVAFRWKTGPVVRRINESILRTIAAHSQFHIVWIDKGVYLWPATVEALRRKAERMIYYTPDTSFFANRSRHFEASAKHYDLVVTTKSFELDRYAELVPASRLHLTTQAYDSHLHRTPTDGGEKRSAAVFIGLCEPERERCVEALLEAGVSARVGGRGWRRFLSRHRNHPSLHYLGPAVFGDAYVAEIARAAVGLGLLSRRFPELHTTRTFEIPACGTLLATPLNSETRKFFREDEVLFYEDYDQLARRLRELMKKPAEIEAITRRGRNRVISGGFDYASVIGEVLARAGELPARSPRR